MKAVELAVKAGRKRQSSITKFVHYCYEDEGNRETIPTYENFCFALALLRSKSMENVLEAKALLEKLLAFQVEGQFPVYLHEYPICRYEGLKDKLSTVIFYILRDFHGVLGDHLRELLSQLQHREPEARVVIENWDEKARTYAGMQKYERGEPEPTLLDICMGEWTGTYAARALADHPIHLRASVVYPAQVTITPPIYTFASHFWGDGNPTHSLIFETQGEIGDAKVVLPEAEVQDEIEIAYYCNIHPDTQIFINGQKATSFQLGDTVQIVSKNKTISLAFLQTEGEGQFWGHLFRGNRKGQLKKDDAYDWVIGLRTVKRNLSSTIAIEYNVDDGA